MQVSKLYRLNCASRSMLLQVSVDGKRFDAVDVPRPEAILFWEGRESEGGEG